MKTPILDTRKKVIVAVVDGFPGGVVAASETVGKDNVKRFKNQMYESAGVKPLTDDEVCALEQVTGTHMLPDYICSLYGGVFVSLPKVEELDNIDLYTRSVNTDASLGLVDLMIQKALMDGEIDAAEAAEILAVHHKHIAARHEEVTATIALFAAKKKG